MTKKNASIQTSQDTQPSSQLTAEQIEQRRAGARLVYERLRKRHAHVLVLNVVQQVIDELSTAPPKPQQPAD